MNTNDITIEIERVIREVAELQKIQLPTLTANLEIVDDLGFTSLAVATLIASLEEVFGVDPFQEEDVMITDVRTISDLTRIYINCLEKSSA